MMHKNLESLRFRREGGNDRIADPARCQPGHGAALLRLIFAIFLRKSGVELNSH